MNKLKIALSLALITVSLFSCKPKFTKLKSGLEYMIVKDEKGGKLATEGSVIKMHIKTTIKTISKSNKVEEKTIEQPKVEISGIYSGSDNAGMESTIILRTGGRMVVKASIGDGTPTVGEWSGDAENVSLYIKSEDPYYDNYGNLRMGGNQLLGRGRITKEGLQINGKFYQRQ
jgi:hypothetical protein